MQVVLHIAGILADGQGVLGGQFIVTHKGGEAQVQYRARALDAAQGIHPVQHHHFLAAPGAGLHGVGKGIQVGVEPRAHILDVKHQHVKGIQHFLVEMAVGPEGAVHRDPRGGVHRGFHLRPRLGIAPDAMLHGKQRG